MSHELFVNGRPKGQLATIRGWEELVHEIELGVIPAEVGRFIQRGWSDKPVTFREQLSGLLEADYLSPESKDIIKAAVKMVPDTGIVSLAAE